mmetsp:Transcript_1688/g.6015  ORF Transcript_1688/g.6015 Transcript_1688/m.6015 type:complete len:193 (+) Transcript_1688:43-621(+)
MNRARAMSAPVRPMSPKTMRKRLKEKMARHEEEEQDRAMLQFKVEAKTRLQRNRRRFEELTEERNRASNGPTMLERSTSASSPVHRMRALTLDMDTVNNMLEQERKMERDGREQTPACQRPVTARGILQQRQKEMLANRLAQEKKMENEKSKMRQYHNELQGRRVMVQDATRQPTSAEGASCEAAASSLEGE